MHEWDVFIAHAASDRIAAFELYRALAPHCRVFLDEVSVRLGDVWQTRIPEAQRASRCTVVLVSSRTDDAYYERDEIAAAIELARQDGSAHRVVPIYLDHAAREVVPYGLRLRNGLTVDEVTPLTEVAARLLREVRLTAGSGRARDASSTMTVVYADDSLPMRAGVVALLGVEQDIEVVAECSDLGGLLETVDRLVPDVVMTDLRMPPTRTKEGVLAAEHVREHHPDVAVVLLTQYVDAECARELVARGSERRGYLLKEHVSHPSTLVAALHAVASGGSYIDPSIVDALVNARAAVPSALDRLTDREREVLAEVASGRSNQAIAERLFVSDRAVEKHINNIFSKLALFDSADANRRVQAALLFLAAMRDR
jgi:DNA-binding NarL/FixJ family response regulator